MWPSFALALAKAMSIDFVLLVEAFAIPTFCNIRYSSGRIVSLIPPTYLLLS